jgi:hypothetical protein
MKALQGNLMTMNSSLIEALNSHVISLQSQLPMEDMVLPGKFDAFLQLTAAVNALDSRLGFFTLKGELPAFENAYDTVNDAFKNLSLVVKKNIHKNIVSVYVVYIGIILFLFTVFMFLRILCH